MLSPTLASNKLAVCTGGGSSYDKHYDNSGGEDLRKLTILYYLNPDYSKEMGGEFRIHRSLEEVEDIQPRGDRLLIFWGDRLVHSVRESFTPSGDRDHRYAFTVWMTATSKAAIYDGPEVKKHFPDLSINTLNHH